jgi:hypothetical protein
MTDQELETLLADACAGLHIDVPVYRTRVVGDRVELHLYGGRVLTWPLVVPAVNRTGESSFAPTDPPAPEPAQLPESSQLSGSSPAPVGASPRARPRPKPVRANNHSPQEPAP